MYRVPVAGLTLPAVANRLDRGVRPRCGRPCLQGAQKARPELYDAAVFETSWLRVGVDPGGQRFERETKREAPWTNWLVAEASQSRCSWQRKPPRNWQVRQEA
jgi:hypothetical protein